MEKSPEVQIRNLDLDPQFRSRNSSADLSMGWLLRLFRSDFFDAWMAVSYLYRYRRKRGVLDYLCNELYVVEYGDLEKYLPQICHMIVYHLKGNATIERFLMDKCSSSIHFAVQVYWFLEAAVEDSTRKNSKKAIEFRRKLKAQCETSAVNGPSNMRTEDALDTEMAQTLIASNLNESQRQPISLEQENGVEAPRLRRSRSLDSVAETEGKMKSFGRLIPVQRSVDVSPQGSAGSRSREDPGSLTGPGRNGSQQLDYYDLHLTESQLRNMSARALRKKIEILCDSAGERNFELESLNLLTIKQERCDYFNMCIALMRSLVKISLSMMNYPDAKRKKRLREELESVDSLILDQMVKELDHKAPAGVVEAGPSAYLRAPHIPLIRSGKPAVRILRTLPDECVVLSTKARVPYMLYVEAVHCNVVNCDVNIFCEHLVSDQLIFPSRVIPPSPSKTPSNADEAEKKRRALIRTVFGELREDKEKRLLGTSPFAGIPNRSIYAFIVKANDDLRQEQLAIQLINAFDSIFEMEKVHALLTPFTIICLSSDAGLVELIPDAVSIHTVKKRTPDFRSLRDFFERAFGPVTSSRFVAAQKRFIQSLAGYSLVQYFMQIKDRHNGNILLGSSGKIVHIDFGYMFSNSPGAINFETAPFKLSAEYLEVLGGTKSRGFAYFQEVFIAGFFAARKHHEVFITLVEILVEGTNMPCMKGSKSLVESLRRRFFLGIPEKEALSKIKALIDESCNNWRTAQYDNFQYLTNKIL